MPALRGSGILKHMFTYHVVSSAQNYLINSFSIVAPMVDVALGKFRIWLVGLLVLVVALGSRLSKRNFPFPTLYTCSYTTYHV